MNRANILHTAVNISMTREIDHGNFDKNMENTGLFQSLFDAKCVPNIRMPMRDECPGFYAAMYLHLTKISRICCGQPNPDDFVDGCNYLAQAGSMLLEWQAEQIASQNGMKVGLSEHSIG